MSNRKWALVPSVGFASVVYVLLLWFAPGIVLLRAESVARDIIDVFKVDLVEAAAPKTYKPPQVEPDATSPSPTATERFLEQSQGFGANPDAPLDELLQQETEQLAPVDLLARESLEVPRLGDRVASDSVQRTHELDRDGQISNRVDAKIVEIAQDTARQDIEVVRRLVQPSPVRAVERGEYPVLRGDGPAEGPLTFSANPLPSLNPGPSLGMDPGLPSFEEGILSPDIMQMGLPDLPVETEMARAPLSREIQKESGYEFLDDLVDIVIDTYLAPDDPQGYFRLRILPREGETIPVLPKDVTFVVDASNSIAQRKLDLTVRGVVDCLQQLRSEDRFSIVIFRGSPTFFRDSAANATPETITAAQEFLKNVESHGETDVYNGITPVIGLPGREGLPGIVVMLSDGHPTTGVLDGRDIINSVTERNTGRTTIYAFGGGNTVNRYLLDLLAYRNKGESRVAEKLEDIHTGLPSFFERLSDPLLVDLGADYGNIGEGEVFPRELPDFYRARPVSIYGRFDPKADREFVMRLRGTAAEQKKDLVFKADLAKAESGDLNIARNWAFQKIYFLIGEVCRLGERPELLTELRELSRKYGIRTSYSD